MCVPRKPLHFSCVFVSCGLSCVVERPGLCLRRVQIRHFLVWWGCYSCSLCVWLCVSVCVYQTTLSHPLLRLVPQLHTRREKGLVMRVCTTHIGSASASQRLIDEGRWRCVFENPIGDEVLWEISLCVMFSAHLRKMPSTCDRIHMLCFACSALRHCARCDLCFPSSWAP